MKTGGFMKKKLSGHCKVAASVVLLWMSAVSAQISNPYEGVNWASWQQHFASLHNHTTVSDGDSTPVAVINALADSGYTIVALTDHSKLNWPWPATPKAEGMLAVQGNELSKYHHILSLFNDYNDNKSSGEEESIQRVQEKGGLSVMNHPKRYINKEKYPEYFLEYATVEWYANLFNTYPSLLGMEVFNSSNWATDTTHWDDVLSEVMPERNVWGFGTDDMHEFKEMGVSRTIVPLPELTEAALRTALTKGAFYFGSQFTVSSSNRGRLPRINSITHDQAGKKITITTREGSSDVVTWHTNQGVKIHTGNTLDYGALASQIGSYVRAHVKGKGGSVFTQPFAYGAAPAELIIQSIEIPDTVFTRNPTADITLNRGADVRWSLQDVPFSQMENSVTVGAGTTDQKVYFSDLSHGQTYRIYFRARAADGVESASLRSKFHVDTTSIIVENFEGSPLGTNLVGGYWFTYDDSSEGGASNVEFDLVASSDDEGMAGRFSYSLEKGTNPYSPYVGATATLWSDTVNLKESPDRLRAVSFRYKGNSFLFSINSAAVKDYDYHSVQLEKSNIWREVILTPNEFAQSWTSSPVELDLERVIGFSWKVIGSDGSTGEFTIDNFKLIGSFEVPVSMESALSNQTSHHRMISVANGSILIETPYTEQLSFSLSDLQGRRIGQTNFISLEKGVATTLSLSSMLGNARPAGVYILTAHDKRGVTVYSQHQLLLNW